MILHNVLSLWLLIASAAGISHPAAPTEKGPSPKATIQWVIQKSSKLQVAGKSNINEFACGISGYYQPDTISYVQDYSGKPIRLTGSLEMDVFRFDCHNNLITKDLRKTLKAEEHPKLTIRFVSLERAPSFENTPQHMKGWVEVELAGVRKTFQISYQFLKENNASYVLNGSRVFCFSDFKLTPPRKLAGAIKIKDEFAVDFRLKLVPIQSS